MAVTLGAEVLLQEADRYLKGKKFALLVNQSAVTKGGLYLFEALLKKGYKPEKIFAPEHGLFGVEQDQITIDDAVDAFTGVKAVSLYGQTFAELHPHATNFEGIDTLVVDIQDIGCRYYTYAYTMAFCIEVAARVGVRVLVCDRPNPLGGIVVEGGIVHANCRSFVGAYPLAVRHSLTLAELALYLNATENWRASIEILKLKNWERGQLYPDTGALWVQPSPNMPTVDTAVVYPGTCLFEGTNVSEGRGTTRPFEIIGAPFVDAKKYTEALNTLNLPGVYFRPVYFKPTFHKFQDSVCGGAFVHVTDRARFESFYTGLMMVRTAHDLWPHEFDWRREPYEYVNDVLAIDLLTGAPMFRLAVEKGDALTTYRASYEEEGRAFARQAKEFYLY